MIEEVVNGQRTQVTTPAELAAAREARGMSQVAVSQRIKLQVRQVGALEEGQWSALPGRAFVRGALRSYGKLLEVDVSPLLETIGGFAEPSDVSALRPLDHSPAHSSGRGYNRGGLGGRMLWVIAGLIGVIAVILYFGSAEEPSRIRSWLPGAGQPPSAGPGVEPEVSPPAPPPSVTMSPAPPAASGPPADGARAPLSSPVASGSGNVGSGSPEAGSAATALSGASLGPSVSRGSPGSTSDAPIAPIAPIAPAAPPANTSPAVAPDSSSAAKVSAASEPAGVIRLKAGKDAWVEVRNADGTLLHNRLLKGGSSIELKGTPPYRLVLGNASTVELTFQGKLQDLKPHIQGNNIARLELR